LEVKLNNFPTRQSIRELLGHHAVTTTATTTTIINPKTPQTISTGGRIWASVLTGQDRDHHRSKNSTHKLNTGGRIWGICGY
jgi:hypothetical protein